MHTLTRQGELCTSVCANAAQVELYTYVYIENSLGNMGIPNRNGLGGYYNILQCHVFAT